MAEMLVEKRRCVESSNSSTQNAAQSSHKKHLEENKRIKNNHSTTIQSNLTRLSPEFTTNDGVSDSADVCAVVGKAKKAAQFLWVLIHGQNCNIGGDRCPHKGCMEAKRVLLHLKTCSAETCAEVCPSNYNGCYQARKLLSHYQKCRERRAKQAGMGRRRRDQHYVCLVCSLVARHARNVLEIPSRKISGKKQIITSFTLATPDINSRHINRELQFSMPPPPPRQRIIQGGQTSNCDLLTREELTPHNSHNIRSKNHLMLFSEVAAAAATPNFEDPLDPPVPTENADDRRRSFLTFAASALQDLRRASPILEDVIDESNVYHRSVRRLRAESYDERALKQKQQQSEHVDPTIELDLKGEQDIESKVVVVSDKILRRSRSASLGILASACINHESINCGTIVEENAKAP